MSAAKLVTVKESTKDLKALLKSSSSLVLPRIMMLIELKRYSETGISKRELAEIIGVNHNSIQTWRNMYMKGGIKGLIYYKKNEGRPKILTNIEHKAMEIKLKDANNGLRGYVELLNWVETEFNKTMNYNTLLKYASREFGSSVKVARKSHIKKDEKLVATFKKTSVKSAKMPLKKAIRNSKP